MRLYHEKVFDLPACSLAACGGEKDSGDSTGTTPPASTDGSGDSGASTDGSGDSGDSTDGSGDSFTTIQDGKLIMATNAAFPPYEMTDDNDNIIGIDPEIGAAIAEKLGLELVIDNIDFDAALLAVQNGSADVVLAGLSYREDRDLVLDFTDSYATGVQVVIVTEDSEINELDDLDGKLIGTQRGTTGYLYASDTPENGGYGEENVIGYDNGITAVQMLLNGQGDAVIIDNGPAKEFVAANPGLRILDTEWVMEDYCAAVNEGNTALLEAINTALNELMNDGTLQAIVDKYITAE